MEANGIFEIRCVPLRSFFVSHTSERTYLLADVRPLTVLVTIQDKVNNPSPDDPFEPDIAVLLKNDKAKFLATAKEWTKKCVIDSRSLSNRKNS